MDLEGIVDGIKKGQVAKLQWNLYGNVSVPYSWHVTFKEFLLSLGFQEVAGHLCLLIKWFHDNTNVFVVSYYVNNNVAATSNESLYEWFETELGKNFEFTSPGTLAYCLGVEFLRSSDGKYLTLSQCKYADNLLKRFDFSDARLVTCPMDPTIKLSLADSPPQVDLELQKEY